MMARVLGVLVATVVVLLPQAAGSQTDDVTEALATAKFRISRTGNLEGTRWLYKDDTYKIIGYATWDPIKRRYTLFDLSSRYHGFLQATTGNPANEYYLQYLWYGGDNRYKGVFVLTLGGRPVTPEETPFGELGGLMLPYYRGNIPPPLPEYDPYISPLKQYGLE